MNEQQRQQELLRQAAYCVRNGDSRSSEALLQQVSTAPPHLVVALAFNAIDYITGDAAHAEMRANPQGDVANIGPFLLLVAARLLHGGICRDFSMHWSSRLDALRAVRQQLQGLLLRPPVRTQWLFPALNEISVAWAVISKLLLLAHGDEASPGASATVPDTAVEFVRDEWLAMLASAVQQHDNDNGGGNDGSTGDNASLVFLSLLRQCVDECGLTGRASLGRGLTLDRHDAVRDAIFKGVMPQLLCAASEALITFCESAVRARNNRVRPGNNGGASSGAHFSLMMRLVCKLQEIVLGVVSWGPSAFAQEFAVDRVPGSLHWPARHFRRCLFATLGAQQQQQLANIYGSGGGGGLSRPPSTNFLLFAAALASYHLGLVTTSITDVALPATQILVQLCSVYTQASSSSSDNDGNDGNNPERWQDGESAQYFHECSSVVLGTCGYHLLNNFLPDPRRIITEQNSNNGGDTDPSEAIELGGALIRQIAIATKRLTYNSLHRSILCHRNSIQCFPSGVLEPLREFTTNTIRFAHDLAMVVRATSCNDSNNNSMVVAEAQIEEPFAEAIEQLIQTWRDFTRYGLEDVECLAQIGGTPLEASLAEGARSVFAFFVRSRVLFANNLREFEGQMMMMMGRENNNNNNNNSRLSAAAGGLVASCIESHGMDYALDQINQVGLLGRNDARAACDLLSELLGSQASEFLSALGGSGDGNALPQSCVESIWYLFKLVAWVITDDETGGSASDVPQAIVNLVASIEKEALDAGAYNSENPDMERELELRTPVFALMRGTLHFCQQLTLLHASRQQQQQQQRSPPPLVVSALLSLLGRYVSAYVDFDSTRATEVSNHKVFAAAFDGGVGIAGPAVQFLSWALCTYPGERETMKEAGALLYALAAKEHIGPWFMADRSRFGIACAAAAGETAANSAVAPGARLCGEQRGKLAGAIISACASDKMSETAMGFLQYYVGGFAPVVLDSSGGGAICFPAVADTVASISALLASAKSVHQLGALVSTIQPYLEAVVRRVTDLNATPPPQQDYDLLAGLLELFLNGIEVCSFNMSNEVIGFMLQSSVQVIEVVGIVIRYAMEHVLPRMAGGSEQRQREEQRHLKMLKAAAALILCAAQWGNLYFPSFYLSLGGSNNGNNAMSDEQRQQSEDEREAMVGTLCTSGLILVLREARATELIEVHELSTVVFRVMKEIARQHTRYFLGVSQEHASVLLDATHWALHSADPELNEAGYSIIEAIAVTPSAAQNMPLLLQRFLADCIEAVVSGSAFEAKVQTALANAMFALGVCLGPDALFGAFMQAVQSTPLLAQEGAGDSNKYVAAFREAMSNDLLQQQSRRNRRLFVPLLRRIVMTVRSASIFS